MKTRLLFLIYAIMLSFNYTIAQIGIGARAGIYLPISVLAESYNTGYGGEASFIYRFNPDFEIALIGGTSSYSADEENLKQRLIENYPLLIEEINIDAEINVEAPLTIYPLMFNIKYLFGKKKFKPYFFFEGGIFFYSITYSGSIKLPDGREIDPSKNRIENESSTTLALGGGFLSSLSKRLFLNVKAKWGIMNNIKLLEEDVNEEIAGTDKTAQTISLSAGLNYYF